MSDFIEGPKVAGGGFQGMSRKQGAAFHKSCIDALGYAGFTITDQGVKIDSVGIEVDIVTENRHGLSMFWECKGSMRRSDLVRPGLERTDTLKKAIANGYLLGKAPDIGCCFPPLLLLASHVPTRGAGYAMLAATERTVIFDVLNDREHGSRLRWLYEATEEEMRADMEKLTLADILRIRWNVGHRS